MTFDADPNQLPSEDEVDNPGIGYDGRPPEASCSVIVANDAQSSSKVKVCSIIVWFILFVWDVGSDLFLAYQFHAGGHLWWTRLTLASVVIPSFVVTLISLYWYKVDDAKRREKDGDTLDSNCSGFLGSRAIRYAFLFLQLDDIFRYKILLIC